MEYLILCNTKSIWDFLPLFNFNAKSFHSKYSVFYKFFQITVTNAFMKIKKIYIILKYKYFCHMHSKYIK